SAPDFRPL
nr:Chain P, 8-mer from Mucin-1 [synthetic construct]